MNSDVAIVLTNEMLWTAIKISAPVLGITLVVGLTISLLQVVTQLQEMTLTFIPKLAAAAICLIVMGGWMLKVLVEYATELIKMIPGLV